MFNDWNTALRSVIAEAIFALLALGAIGPASAQTATPGCVASPDISHEVAHTNKIVAIQADWEPGQCDKPHSTIGDGLLYFVTDCNLIKHRADGTTIRYGLTPAGTLVQTVQGDSIWLENVGQNNCRLLIFVPK